MDKLTLSDTHVYGCVIGSLICMDRTNRYPFSSLEEIFSNLFGSVNVTLGEKEDRLMMTGMHSVADIFCVGCGSIVGWKYVSLAG